MSSELSPENETYIQGKIASGFFSSREDAVDAGIELLRKRDELIEQVREGRRQLDEGEFIEYDDDSLSRRFEQLKGRAAKRGQAKQ